VDLDTETSLRGRVNNGTPRPVTVQSQLLHEHPDVVVDFLVRSLDAAARAATDPSGVRDLQERFLYPHGFLGGRVDVAAWASSCR